jgi:hypothetical protein
MNSKLFFQQTAFFPALEFLSCGPLYLPKSSELSKSCHATQGHILLQDWPSTAESDLYLLCLPLKGFILLLPLAMSLV